MTTDTLVHETEEIAEAASPRQFSYFDRCEVCGYQAFYVAFRERTEPASGPGVENETTQELCFCKHHGERHTPALATAGWSVLDFTHMLNENPSVSASV